MVNYKGDAIWIEKSFSAIFVQCFVYGMMGIFTNDAVYINIAVYCDDFWTDRQYKDNVY